ncbi:YgaP family membrane protein [Sphingobacterium suaedae]|uniref:DUF2892 domain-containing protein n=1 Tax=Sphingobacterium suaedae TaxID=1686402 RepID=A0ABW5KGK8_9SPHI
MGIIELAVEKVKDKIDEACEQGEISNSERLLSVIAGGFILGFSAKRLVRHPLGALSGLTLGGALVARGITGKCPVKGALEAEKVEDDVTVIEHRYFVK